MLVVPAYLRMLRMLVKLHHLLQITCQPGPPLAGLRMRQPRSLLVGLMWLDPQRQDPLGNIRSVCALGEMGGCGRGASHAAASSIV